MQLEDYIISNRVKPTVMALSVGISRVALWKLRRGINTPSKRTVQRIARITDGAVQANDFFGSQTSSRRGVSS